MNEIQDIYKHITSLQEQVMNLSKKLSEQAALLSPLAQGATFQLEQIKRHNDLIATMKKEIESLKAEIQRQGESFAFLKQTVSH